MRPTFPFILLKTVITLSLLILTFGWVCIAQPTALAIVDGTVITATGDAPLEQVTILIRDGQITHVGTRPSDLSGYHVIDAAKKWITPGLIDTNVHLILTVVPEFYIKYEDQLEEIAIQSAQVGLKYGLTTMADTWGPLEPLLAARDRIRSGEYVGSDVLIAGNIIGTGGPFTSYFMKSWGLRGKSLRYGDWVSPPIQRRINNLWEAGMGPDLMAVTPAEAAARMRAYIERGVDFIKLGISGHGIEPVEPLMFTDEVLEAMVAEIRDAGLPFQTHTFTIASLQQALRLAPDLLQHPNVMSPAWGAASDAQKEVLRDLMQQIRQQGIYSGLMAVPEKRQLEIYQNWKTDGTEDPDLDELMRYRQPWFEGVTYDQLAAGIRVWLNAGVPFTLATDQGPEAADLGPTVWGRLGRAHFDRMIGLQDAGVSPMDILIAATRNGAAAYNLLDQKGTVETGKIADLLILNANPLEDIGNVRDIHLIIKDGRIVARDALPTIKVLDYDPEKPWPY